MSSDFKEFKYKGLTVKVPQEVLDEAGMTLEEFEKMLYEQNVDFMDPEQSRPVDEEDLQEIERREIIKNATKGKLH